MRGQYANKKSTDDIMTFASDISCEEDSRSGYWVQLVFATAFEWVTDLGVHPFKEKKGFQNLLFSMRKWSAYTWGGIGKICSTGDVAGVEGDVAGVEDDRPATMVADKAPKVGKPYTMEQVSAHNEKNDCWVAINGKVCNLTKFMDVHPGGVSVVMAQAGKDATSEWNAIHSRDVIEKICPEIVVGYVVDSQEDASADGLGT